MEKKQVLELKRRAQNLYYTLRSQGLSHALALAAVTEYLVEAMLELDFPGDKEVPVFKTPK